jgi:predicted nucleotidyltransferase
VLHGGFVESEVFRDIDVVILLALDVGDVIDYVEGLREELEKATGLPVDVQVLNEAPPAFAYQVLSKGRILVEREAGLAARLRLHAADDLERLRRARRILEDPRD